MNERERLEIQKCVQMLRETIPADATSVDIAISTKVIPNRCADGYDHVPDVRISWERKG